MDYDLYVWLFQQNDGRSLEREGADPRMRDFVLSVTREENVMLRPPGARFGTRLVQIRNQLSEPGLIGIAVTPCEHECYASS